MINTQYQQLQQIVEEGLEKQFCHRESLYGVLYDAMRYSVLGGGKRLRGVLMLECGRICGLTVEQTLPFACALEMIHASTLIHDDLPCMDNDDFRRGKPACHIAFGEDIALLAGDALYAYALQTLTAAIADKEYDGNVVAALTAITSLSGPDGVFGGQILDKRFEREECSFEELLQLHGLKTGALISACARIPCILSRATPDVETALMKYVKKLGLAFQVKDDLLDVEGNFAQLGKAICADEEKSTFISMLGVEKSKEYLYTLIADAVDAVKDIDDNALLLWICDFVMNREM